jgi:IS1 family transposase
MVSMNRLPIEKRAQILSLLTEGNSLRATSRIVGCSINTVTKLLLDVGEACAAFQDDHLRDLPCKTIEADEIWSFVYSKQKNVPEDVKGQFGFGDVWTWTALDADTKLIASWYVGERKYEDARAFMEDLKARLRNRIQLTTDGHGAYIAAVGLTFRNNIDWAQLQKEYRSDPSGERRYSPPVCTGVKTRILKGDPDPARISTSYVERSNLTMRMSMRRFTRLTNGFSKKLDNHMAAIAIHFMHYNFARPHSSLSIAQEDGPAVKRTPAMAAGVADHIWTLTEIAALLDSK